MRTNKPENMLTIKLLLGDEDQILKYDAALRSLRLRETSITITQHNKNYQAKSEEIYGIKSAMLLSIFYYPHCNNPASRHF